MPSLSSREIVTPPMRLSFPALFEPKPTVRGGDVMKYQASFLLPEDLDLKPFYDCVKAAMVERFGKVIKMPARNNPIKPCSEKDIDGYVDGWHYINAKSGYAPGVVDQRRQEIIDPEMIYAGCWVRAHLTAYAWDHPTGGKGVSFSLNSVQLVKDGERLDGRRSAAEVFDAIEVDDDDVSFGNDEGGPTEDAEELFG